MSGWTVEGILQATGGQLVRGTASTVVSGISIDSRRLVSGEAFVAIQGHRFNGHDFLQEAVRRGTSCLVVSRRLNDIPGPSSLPLVFVEETTRALGDLARFHRQRHTCPIIAVTGSCGKTTTKELIAHLAGEAGDVLKSQGTQNNHIGVPLTLLHLAPHHQLAVVEMGTNHPGEIAYLASIAQPDVAVITNVGPVHLEFLGSVPGVMREKLSLLDVIPPLGTVVLPGDQLDVCLEAQHHLQPRVRVATFGTTDRCDLQALDLQRASEGMRIRLRDHLDQWTVPLLGTHNVENTLAAVTCVWALGLPLSIAKERLPSFEPIPLRSQVVRCNGLTILNDCYNANPLSFARALETLVAMEVHRTVAIVGDMLELGAYAPSAHQAIGHLATRLGVDTVLAVGQYAEDVAEGVHHGRGDGVAPPPAAWTSGPASAAAQRMGPQGPAAGGGVATYRTVPELLEQLPQVLREGDGLLVKGSRKLNLERVTDFLIRSYHGGSTR